MREPPFVPARVWLWSGVAVPAALGALLRCSPLALALPLPAPEPDAETRTPTSTASCAARHEGQMDASTMPSRERSDSSCEWKELMTESAE